MIQQLTRKLYHELLEFKFQPVLNVILMFTFVYIDVCKLFQSEEHVTCRGIWRDKF